MWKEFTTIAGLALLLGSQTATAGTISCPGTAATNDREFTLTTDTTATCLLTGSGNLSGNANGNNPDPFLVNNPQYVLIDKSDGDEGTLSSALSSTESLINGVSGDFTITAPGYSTFAIGFNSGNGQLNPDWAVFGLVSGTLTGDWTISNRQALSHVNLYGIPSAVPLPAAAWLFISGLVGLYGAKRRKIA